MFETFRTKVICNSNVTFDVVMVARLSIFLTLPCQSKYTATLECTVEHDMQLCCIAYGRDNDETMTSNICGACKSILETRDVQMRSADEAHTSITSCPNCPVNVNKIDSTRMPLPPVRGMNRKVRRSLPSIPRKSDNIRSLYAIVLDIPLDHTLMNIDLESQHLIRFSQVYNKRASDTAMNRLLSTFDVVNGMFKGSCISFKSSRRIGMGITADTYEALGSVSSTNSQVTIKGDYTKYQATLKYNCYVYCEFNEKNRKFIVELGHEIPSNYVVKNIVNTVYSLGIISDDIGRYVSIDTIAMFSNLSPRGWDASIPPATGHVFTCKPDGQNVWLFWIGNVWYKFSPQCRGGVREWIWTDTNNSNDVVAISAEDMASYGCIVIDCFTDENGGIANSTRDIEWVISTAKSVLESNSELPLLVREYFNDYESVQEYIASLPYPVDGTVAIRNGSTEILKIKPLRSIELALTENHKLITSDGTPVIDCPDHIGSLYKPGSILEIRFTMSSSSVIDVSDIFIRTDKVSANSDNAVSNIVRSAYKLLTPEDNERRIALLWCNNLRKHLHSLAINSESNKNIIVDIGTGTGQSLDSISQSDSISYVYIEPDASRCRSVARRLSIRKIHTNPNDIVSMIKSLKTRSTKSVIMNCSISDILDNGRASEILFGETKSITCTFSMQFIVADLHYISSKYHVPIYGCGYVYDSMNNDNVLINDCGVLMKRENDSEASVKWGGDKKYIEPITIRRDYSGIGRIVLGSEIIVLPDRSLSSGAHNICKHVAVILS